MLSDPNGPVEPVPFSIDEFAKETGLDRRAVLKKIADGTLKTVSVRGHQRVPVSEFRRIVEEVLDRVQDVRMALALALEAGLIKEVDVDERGFVIYERRELPRARQ